MVTSITDPDALADELYRADIIGCEAKDVIVEYLSFSNVQEKTRSLLQIIEGKVKGQPCVFHKFRAVLTVIPELSELASRLISSYSKFMMMYGMF